MLYNLIDRHIDRLTDRLTNRLTDRLTDGLTDRQTQTESIDSPFCLVVNWHWSHIKVGSTNPS